MPGGTILPSPRPLLIWLGADALCAVALTLLAVTLLALWRRPARTWRLGLAALAASWLAAVATLWVLRAYNDVKIYTTCGTPDDCATTAQTISSAVLWASVISAPLLAVTLATLLAALILSAGGRQREESGAGFWDWSGRWLGMATANAIAVIGALALTHGILDWILFAPLADPTRAGDGIGQIPLFTAIMSTIGGVVVFGVGLALTLYGAGALTPRRGRRAGEQPA